MFVLQWKNFEQLDLIVFGSVLQSVPPVFYYHFALLDCSVPNHVNVFADDSFPVYFQSDACGTYRLQVLH